MGDTYLSNNFTNNIFRLAVPLLNSQDCLEQTGPEHSAANLSLKINMCQCMKDSLEGWRTSHRHLRDPLPLEG